MSMVQDIIIPPIRQDLNIYPGSYASDGSPTWTIYDPLVDDYFKIGWFEFECLQRFPRAGTSSALVGLVNAETPLSIEISDVIDFVGFLANCGLLKANTAEVQNLLRDRIDSVKPSLLSKFFLRYLFIKAPFFQPKKFLQSTFPFIRFMFTRGFLSCVFMLLGFGIFLTVQRWDEFLNTFTLFFSLENVLLIMIATIIIKTAHELGHAYTAHKYNVPISTMGVIFIVLYPILYTETTNAWRLGDRKKRLHIAAAGLMAEMCLASVALIVWHISTPGIVQNLSYFIAFISFGLSVFVNANPLMKFDGYYLLSDVLGIDNLQTRATRLFQWKIRTKIVGLNEKMPETLLAKRKFFLISFGFAQVVYKCFLYSGIAFAVYYLLLKPLGFILALVTVGVFLGLPVVKEVCYWFRERDNMVKKIKARVLFSVIIVLFLMSVLPLSGVIKIPAVLHYKNYESFYAPMPVRIDGIHVRNSEVVSKGQALITLSSKKMQEETEKTRLNLDLYRKVKRRQQASPDLSHENIEIDQIIKETQIKLKGLILEQDKLIVRAPFNGITKDISADLHEGRWVNEDQLLGRVVNKNALQVSAFVSSEDIVRVKKPASGTFKSDVSLFGSYRANLEEVASADTKYISYPELSSVYGGSIPAERDGDSTVSQASLYTLKLSVEGAEEISSTQKGTLILKVRPTSFFGKIFRRLTSLVLREVGS